MFRDYKIHERVDGLGNAHGSQIRGSRGLFDIAGRSVLILDGVTSHTLQLEVKELSMGPYFVRVFNGLQSRTKKLIIH